MSDEERERQREEMIRWVTELCRREIPEAGPWGLKIKIGVTIDWTGVTELRTVAINVWSIDRWVWWVSNDLHAIKWQYRQALMKRHYEDRRAA